MRNGRSRYFVLTRVNPTDKDVGRFVSSCVKIEATLYGYCIQPWKENRRIMRAFFILAGRSASVYQLEPWFPNFLVLRMPATLELGDLGVTEDKRGDGLVVIGQHPFHYCKVNLSQVRF
jgi:hypothetical protein